MTPYPDIPGDIAHLFHAGRVLAESRSADDASRREEARWAAAEEQWEGMEVACAGGSGYEGQDP